MMRAKLTATLHGSPNRARLHPERKGPATCEKRPRPWVEHGDRETRYSEGRPGQGTRSRKPGQPRQALARKVLKAVNLDHGWVDHLYGSSVKEVPP